MSFHMLATNSAVTTMATPVTYRFMTPTSAIRLCSNRASADRQTTTLGRLRPTPSVYRLEEQRHARPGFGGHGQHRHPRPHALDASSQQVLVEFDRGREIDLRHHRDVRAIEDSR